MQVQQTKKLRICPFTLESFDDCDTGKTFESERICPFTLELCSFDGIDNFTFVGGSRLEN